MSNSLVFFNCSASLMDRIRQVLAGQISTLVCDSWNEVCDVMQAEVEHGLVAEVPEDLVAVPSDSERDYSLSVHRRQVVAPGDETAAQGVAEMQDAEMQDAGTLANQIDQWERRIIADTLRKNRNHRKETAAVLGISRVTLYNKMKKFRML